MNLKSVADLVTAVKPFVGQDLQIVYHVYTDMNMNVDASIATWTLVWTLYSNPTDAAAVLTKTTASGITLASPLATVTLSAANMALSAYATYYMQLWRNEVGNLYPLTGPCPFQPQPKPPLA